MTLSFVRALGILRDCLDNRQHSLQIGTFHLEHTCSWSWRQLRLGLTSSGQHRISQSPSAILTRRTHSVHPSCSSGAMATAPPNRSLKNFKLWLNFPWSVSTLSKSSFNLWRRYEIVPFCCGRPNLSTPSWLKCLQPQIKHRRTSTLSLRKTSPIWQRVRRSVANPTSGQQERSFSARAMLYKVKATSSAC